MRTILFVIAIVGCDSPKTGSNPDRSTTGATNFLGSWSDTTGTVTNSCGGGQQMLPAGQLQITITASSSGLVITFADPMSCQVAATVSGSTATVSADKTCPVTGGTLTVKKGGTFTTPDGVTMSAVFDIVTDDGKGTTCTQSNTVALAH
jgi:hypothetical protein